MNKIAAIVVSASLAMTTLVGLPVGSDLAGTDRVPTWLCRYLRGFC